MVLPEDSGPKISVETVLEFAKGRSDTAVIITADHETCGLQVSSDKETYNGKATTVSGKEISYNFSATSHTDTPVPVFTYGFELVANLCPTYASVDKIKNSEIYLVVCDLILYS